jgi:hypothetical protein
MPVTWPRRIALALVPFAVVAGGARLLVPVAAARMARGIAVLASAAPVVRAEPEAHPDGESTAEAPDDATSGTGASAQGGHRRTSRRAGGASGMGAGARSGLDVSAERVARLTARQLRGIGATTVVDAEGRPVGARLSGVGALGIGLVDGDVVTSIDGQPTVTGDAATAAAMAAYGSGEAAVHGRVVRDGQAIAVTVHVPPRATVP